MVAFKPKAALEKKSEKSELTQPTDLVVVARIGVAYGVKGWVKLHPFSHSPDALQSSKKWWIAPYLGEESTDVSDLSWVAVSPVVFKAHSDNWVAQFKGWDDRLNAEKHKGWQIAVSRSDFPESDENEFYWVDLMDAEVHNQDGVLLGVVTRLLENTAQTVLQIGMPDNKTAPEYLIPFVSVFIGDVDLKSEPKTIQVVWDVDATA